MVDPLSTSPSQALADVEEIVQYTEDLVDLMHVEAAEQVVLSRHGRKPRQRVIWDENAIQENVFFGPLLLLMLSSSSAQRPAIAEAVFQDIRESVSRQPFETIDPWSFVQSVGLKFNIQWLSRDVLSSFLNQKVSEASVLSNEQVVEFAQPDPLSPANAPASSTKEVLLEGHIISDSMMSLDECISVSNVACNEAYQAQSFYWDSTRRPKHLKDDLLFVHCFAFFACDAAPTTEARLEGFLYRMHRMVQRLPFAEMDLVSFFDDLRAALSMPALDEAEWEEALAVAKAPFPESKHLSTSPTEMLDAGLVMERFIHRRTPVSRSPHSPTCGELKT